MDEENEVMEEKKKVEKPGVSEVTNQKINQEYSALISDLRLGRYGAASVEVFINTLVGLILEDKK